VTTIVYLHGFRSSPASVKATQFRAAVDALPAALRPRLYVPNLQMRPAAAIASVTEWLRHDHDPDALAFVGSSLGGFYATHLAERYGARAVLVNPAVYPARDLAPYIGVQTNLHTGEAFEVLASDFDDLRALEVGAITRPERYWLLVETADEVLDYREAVAHYAGAHQYVRGGGDHTFTDFAPQIPSILRFCGVPALLP